VVVIVTNTKMPAPKLSITCSVDVQMHCSHLSKTKVMHRQKAKCLLHLNHDWHSIIQKRITNTFATSAKLAYGQCCHRLLSKSH